MINVNVPQPLGTIILTVVGGIFSLILARKTKLPSILFLLILGILSGPSFANLVQPSIFASNFPHYISFMVALILFEGGISLKFSQFRDISRVIQNLLTVGALMTLVAVSVAVYFVAHLSWPKSLLFGALMIVTGPTVVIPILHRIRIKEKLHNILKWEAILIDPLGVVVAVVLFEFLMTEHVGPFLGLGLFFGRFILGIILGLIAGFIMFQGLTRHWFLRAEGGELGGLFVLAITLLFYGISEWIMPDSGLVAATTAGIFIGNQKFPFQQQIFHFKEQITLLALATLFILISSYVPIDAIQDIAGEGLALLLIVILVVRPLSVFLSTLGDQKLSFRERLFLAFLAPRGIVSATLASLFAIAFEAQEVGSRGIFLPLAFFVISGTIVFYAAFSSFFAWVLGVREEEGKGVVIVGANALGVLFAEELKKRNVPVTFIDTSPANSGRARRSGFPSYFGSGFDNEFIESLDIKGVGQMIALTPNHEVNVLCCQTFSRFLKEGKIFRLWHKNDTWEMVTSADYDESWGKPMLHAADMTIFDILEHIEDGKFKILSKKLEAPLKITPEELKREKIALLFFGITNGAVIFPAPASTLSPQSEICYLEFAQP